MNDCLIALGSISSMSDTKLVQHLTLETPLLLTLGLVMVKGANTHRSSALWVISNLAANSKECADAVLQSENLFDTMVDAIGSRDHYL
jgi:hypothetical protein